MLDFNTLATFSTCEKIYKTFPIGRGFLKVFQRALLCCNHNAHAP